MCRLGEKPQAHHQILFPNIDDIIPHLVIGLDEKIHSEEGVLAFGFRLERLSKKEVSGIEKEDFFTLFFYLGDKGRFLGDTAKRVPESPAGLNFSHHIIGVDDSELDFGWSLPKGCLRQTYQ